MDKYIESNKAAWEEAFDNRTASWGADIVRKVQAEDYPFFYEDVKELLRKYDLRGKTVGQFCCNNGRELLSLVKSGKAAKGYGFDIAENQVEFANQKARELQLPCEFKAVNIYDIQNEYLELFDFVIITIGALCWFKDLNRFFEIVAKCMKPTAQILIHEQHPCTNMIATEGDDLFDSKHPLECKFSYFEHEWTGNQGMFYITQKTYPSKTFTDYTHPMSEIISGMCNNKIVITGMREFDYDISDGFADIDKQGYPLSVIIQGRKEA